VCVRGSDRKPVSLDLDLLPPGDGILDLIRAQDNMRRPCFLIKSLFEYITSSDIVPCRLFPFAIPFLPSLSFLRPYLFLGSFLSLPSPLTLAFPTPLNPLPSPRPFFVCFPASSIHAKMLFISDLRKGGTYACRGCCWPCWPQPQEGMEGRRKWYINWRPGRCFCSQPVTACSRGKNNRRCGTYIVAQLRFSVVEAVGNIIS
jgi:hypothetical protein